LGGIPESKDPSPRKMTNKAFEPTYNAVTKTNDINIKNIASLIGRVPFDPTIFMPR
jgi:hypothetical protein